MRGTAMTGEKFTLMQYSVHAILGLIDAEDFVIPEIQRPFFMEAQSGQRFNRFFI